MTSDRLLDSPSKLFSFFDEQRRILHEIKSHLRLYSTQPFISTLI